MSRIKNLREEALAMHKDYQGKIEVRVKVPVRETDDLTLAYSPGVAEPCMEIHKNPADVDVYTNHSNFVCVVSNGTAVLGLGDGAPVDAAPREFRGRRVLLASGSPACRDVLARLLDDLRMTVRTVDSGTAALEAARAALAEGAPFDLALVDHYLPGAGGLDCAAALGRLSNGLLPRLLLVPASYMDQYHDAPGLDAGTRILPKPVWRASLRNAVVAALGLDLPPIPLRGSMERDEPDDTRAVAGGRVLLAEDNEINQEVALNLLESLGMRVALAKDGAEAVELCRGQSFDLIFMDIQMPIMDGLTATRKIRALPGIGPSEPPIIAMTAHAMSGDREKSLEAGMNDHITKPIDPRTLRRKLCAWLARKTA